MSQGFKDLKVYQTSFSSDMEVFELTKKFPKEELYSLTDQIRRSSRSICTNLAEAYRKRLYPKHFLSKLTDADAEANETIVWIDFSKECKYINAETHTKLLDQYEQIGRMLGSMINNHEKFCKKD